MRSETTERSGRFVNPPGSPHSEATPWDFLAFFFRQAWMGLRPPKVPPGHVWSRERVQEGLAQYSGQPSLTWLGHSAFLLRLAGKNFLLDPFLTGNAGPGPFGPKRFVESPIRPDDLPHNDAVLITHNHYDHLDKSTLARLQNRNAIEAFVPQRLGSQIARFGFQQVHEMKWHETVSVGDVEVRALPAIHWSKRGLMDKCRSLWCGYAFTADDLSICYCGDTAYGPVFKEIGNEYGPFDIAFVGIGAYEPSSIMLSSHTTPEEAVQIGKDLRARTLVAMHWGTIILSDEDPWEPPERFRAAGLAAGYAPEDLWVMAVGETRPLKSG